MRLLKTKASLILVISLITLTLFILFPYLYLGEEAYIRIHDNLDNEFVYFYLLKKHNLLFASDGTLESVMEGLPTYLFHLENSILFFFCLLGVCY